MLVGLAARTAWSSSLFEGAVQMPTNNQVCGAADPDEQRGESQRLHH